MERLPFAFCRVCVFVPVRIFQLVHLRDAHVLASVSILHEQIAGLKAKSIHQGPKNANMQHAGVLKIPSSSPKSLTKTVGEFTET